MSFHLKDDFQAGQPISAVPVSWFNGVAKFINNLIPGDNVKFEKHDDGTPTVIEAEAAKGTDLTPPFVRGANHAGDAFHPSSLTPSVSVDVPGQMQATWERGATGRGVKMNVLTSLFMNGTMFYGAFAELSFDENGCLCKVETAKYWSRVQ